MSENTLGTSIKHTAHHFALDKKVTYLCPNRWMLTGIQGIGKWLELPPSFSDPRHFHGERYRPSEMESCVVGAYIPWRILTVSWNHARPLPNQEHRAKTDHLTVVGYTPECSCNEYLFQIQLEPLVPLKSLWQSGAQSKIDHTTVAGCASCSCKDMFLQRLLLQTQLEPLVRLSRCDKVSQSSVMGRRLFKRQLR